MKRRRKPRNRKVKRTRIENFIGKGFLGCILLIAVINLIVPSKEKSEEENRMLTQKPAFSITSMVSGSYMEQYEKYQADQFFARDIWRSLKVGISRLGGSREENDVYIGKDGQLLEKIAVPDQKVLKTNLKAMKAFAEQYSDVETSMVLVPDAANILSDSLPALASTADQNQYISQVRKELGDTVNWVNAVKVLNKHKDEKIYYKTDHHWTSQGAYYVFQEAAKTLGIQESSVEYVSYPVTASFNGVLASKSGCRLDEKEEINIYVPQAEDNDVVVNYVDEQRKTTSLYDSSKLNERDKYAVYLGGNSSVIDIRTVSGSNRRLLIIKDSYANAFVQFLTPYFREIVLVDPRYYSGTIGDIMDTYQITDAMFLYSANMFFQDNNISGVLSSEQ